MSQIFVFINKKNNNFFIKIKNILLLIFYNLLFLSYNDKIFNIGVKNRINNIFRFNKNQTNFKKRKIKVCICALGKKENKYIREFIKHYLKYGVDKIYLYDNNDIDDERFDTILSDYIETKFVEIINYRGKVAPQFKIFDNCYKNNYRIYDWLIYYDIDEFINLKNYSNIKDFLDKKIFKKCKSIYLNCIRHTDNDLLYYDNRTLAERFPDINWNSNMYTVKTIIRGNIKGIRFKTSHWLDKNINGCNINGKIIIPSKKKKLDNNINTSEIKAHYIDHYCFKSTEEYINKINKGDGIFGYNNKIRMHKINLYFNYNKLTLEKINYIEKECRLNLKEYRIKLNIKN